VYKARFDRPGAPDVVAVSNYTWCPTRLQQIAAAEIISNAVQLGSNTKLFRVNSQQGTQLMLLNAQTYVAAGGQLKLLDRKGKARSACASSTLCTAYRVCAAAAAAAASIHRGSHAVHQLVVESVSSRWSSSSSSC